MAIPIVLPNGFILVYGWGQTRNGDEGILTPNNTIFKFADVYRVWDGGETYVYGGEPVMWKDGDEYCRLAYQGNPYTLIQARLVTKDIPPPP